MSKYRYSDLEKEINSVLLFQNAELNDISFADKTTLDARISESEKLLQRLGYQLPEASHRYEKFRKIMVVPTWESLCMEAEKADIENTGIESIFTDEELRDNSQYIRVLQKEFNALYHLDKNDLAISALAGILGAAIEILMVGIPKKTPTGISAGKLSDYIRSEFSKRFPEEEMERLANSKVSKVPFDAQDNRNTEVYVDGLSAYYHRLLSLGHDPLLGFVFGVFDILTGRMTTIDKSGNIVSQVMNSYTDRTEKDIFSAIAKQLLHLKSDITTSMGLPVPLMSLFNLLQFGSIGEAEQTIAEIVQGMYYEGYDFIHFCSMSVPMMIIEALVRMCYAFKKIKEGHSVKDSLPITLNREKHPKLATMLFIAHAGASAINAGKVYFTQNPLAINYPQWLAFGKYSYSQLKWILLQKPALRNNYIAMNLDRELFDIISADNMLFDDFSKEYIVVFE